jgi:hypothetical protein
MNPSGMRTHHLSAKLQNQGKQIEASVDATLIFQNQRESNQNFRQHNINHWVGKL